MRKARFTDGEIVAILREADRELVLAVAKRNRISEQTMCSWRKRRPASEAARPRVAERELEIEVMKEVAQKTGERAGLAGGKPSAVAGGRAAGAAQGCPGPSRTASARRRSSSGKPGRMVSRQASRQVPRRVPEPRMVPLPRRSNGVHRRMAAAQRSAAAFESQLSHAQRVRGARSKTSAPSGNGPDVRYMGTPCPAPGPTMFDLLRLRGRQGTAKRRSTTSNATSKNDGL
jgi:putative transposase